MQVTAGIISGIIWAMRHPHQGIVEAEQMDFEEVYRFNYSAAFCNKAVTITIGRRLDSITLDLYLFDVNNGESECKTISHIIKQLDKKNWEDLIKGISYTDFWGLKEDNGRHGSDGSSLRVSGYERPIKAFEGKFKTINRWAAEDMAIGALFKKFLDLSGTKISCFYFTNE